MPDDPQLKQILPFLQRAEEIQKAEPLVAYYCRLYAVEKAFKTPSRSPEVTGLLKAVLTQLEKDKSKLKLDPAQDPMYCEGFAMRIFANADNTDRAGRSDARTAQAFYAAGCFFDILHQFGDMQPDLEEKQKYAIWKAAEIGKAIRQGRVPPPGGVPVAAPGGTPAAPPGPNDARPALDASSSFRSAGFPPAPSATFPPQPTAGPPPFASNGGFPSPPTDLPPPPAATAPPRVAPNFPAPPAPVNYPAQPPPAASTPAPPPAARSGFQPSTAAIMEAQKQAKFAVSSLSFNDVASALGYLAKAQELLTTPQ